MYETEELNIMGNIKLIENYKNYLLSSVADIFMTMSKGSRMDTLEAQEEISEIILLSYLLGSKLGIDYSSIDETVLKRLKVALAEGGSDDKKCQDYAGLIAYLKKNHIE